MTNIDKLKYPVGPFRWPEQVESLDIESLIDQIESFPELLTSETSALSENELNWKYRPDGWNIRQVIHHCADSHFNSFVRFKLALTEDSPSIKPYEEAAWAELPDSQGSIDTSLSILNGLHNRWCQLLRKLDNSDLQRTYFHPEQKATRRLDETIALYAWHCEHHLAHIKLGKLSKGKYN